MKKEYLVWVALGAVVLIAIAYFGWKSASTDKFSADFAKCLSQKGVRMYGTFWCPHCNAQKEAFGKNWGYVDYVECSAPDGRSQLQVCADAGIEGYPTWVFPDGNKLAGEVTAQQLSMASGCALT